jgi:antitoxin component YwqK of YwqJK toxin-antitoxin module
VKYFSSFFTTLICFICCSNAQNGTVSGINKDGVQLEYNVFGKVQKLCSYKGGFLDGWFAEFDENGKLKKEGLYKNGVISGVGYEYENDAIKRKITWIQTDSANKIYSEIVYDTYSGFKRSEGIWKNNLKDSIWIHYDEKEKVRALERFSVGKRKGFQEKYYPNGNLAEKTFLLNGVFNGNRILLTENGDTTEFGNYIDGKKNGIFTLCEPLRIKDLFQDERSYKIIANYINGKLNGNVIIRYLSGKVAVSEFYENDRLTGNRKLYFENGNVSSFCNYLNGIKNGDEKFYYDNGQLKTESRYLNGSLEGYQIYYFENGAISERFTFQSGDLLMTESFYPNKIIRERKKFKSGKINTSESFSPDGKRLK